MHPGRTGIVRTLAFLLLAGIVAAGLYAALAAQPFGIELSQKGVADRLAALGPWRGVGIAVLMVLHSFVPFPAEIVTFMAGHLLGPVWGTVYVWSGAMVGAIMAFALARAFGRSFVDALLPDRARDTLKAWSTTKSATTLLVARLGEQATGWGVAEALSGAATLVSSRSARGVDVSYVAPLRFGGAVVGSISAGVALDQEFVDRVGRAVGAKLVLLARNGAALAGSHRPLVRRVPPPDTARTAQAARRCSTRTVIPR